MERSIDIARKIEVAGWGAFLIWIGVSLLLNTGWGIGLAGIGAVMLAAQLARRHFGLGIEGFGAVVGVLFLAGGFGALYNADLPLVPLAFLLAGATLVVSLFPGSGSPQSGK